jgi:hypothetical protein
VTASEAIGITLVALSLLFAFLAWLSSRRSARVSEEQLQLGRKRIEGADEARGLAGLARREQSSIYEPQLAVPGPGR